jgi:regulation of enolase protein 1 (concanavalin A-like superfamily)
MTPEVAALTLYRRFHPARNELWLRISRTNSDFIVEHSGSAEAWELLRIAHFRPAQD